MGRSFIRSTEVSALNRRIQNPVISAINRWQKIEQEKGTRLRFSMFHNCDDVVLILDSILQLYRPLRHW